MSVRESEIKYLLGHFCPHFFLKNKDSISLVITFGNAAPCMLGRVQWLWKHQTFVP